MNANESSPEVISLTRLDGVLPRRCDDCSIAASDVNPEVVDICLTYFQETTPQAGNKNMPSALPRRGCPISGRCNAHGCGCPSTAVLSVIDGFPRLLGESSSGVSVFLVSLSPPAPSWCNMLAGLTEASMNGAGWRQGSQDLVINDGFLGITAEGGTVQARPGQAPWV